MTNIKLNYLTQVTIPKSVTSIGSEAFKGIHIYKNMFSSETWRLLKNTYSKKDKKIIRKIV